MRQIRALTVLFVGNIVLLFALLVGHLLIAANTNPELSGWESANLIGKVCGVTCGLLSVLFLISSRIYNLAMRAIEELTKQIDDLKAQIE